MVVEYALLDISAWKVLKILNITLVLVVTIAQSRQVFLLSVEKALIMIDCLE